MAETPSGAPSQTPRLRPPPAWAHAHGFVDLRADPVLPPAEVRGLVEERIHRYCWGFDERRVDILTDCFTVDAVWQGSVMGETTVGPFEGREAAIGWLTRFWPHQRDQRRHILVNLIVDDYTPGADGTAAVATAYAYLMLMGSQDASTRLESVGLYRFDLVRADESGWRIAVLTAGFDSPFWKGEARDMSGRHRERFGVGSGQRSEEDTGSTPPAVRG